jgi:Protein of unknown function (DUF1549)/Protein of unknown function (DUF1553)
MPLLPSRHRFSWMLCLLLVAAPSIYAQPPLHQRIDEGIQAGKADFKAHAAPLASDEEFLRRIYLDLTGSIPSSVEARTFLADISATKRQQLIDRLLASPAHARHLANVLDITLMERRPDKHVPRAQWQEYLRASFAANKPWDELTREVLSADGSDEKTRPAAKFYLDREAEPHLVTRDIARMFLGMNLTCAQCHDSPVVSDYRQDVYYGIFAFLNRTSLFTDRAKKLTVLAEKADGEATFQSVFDDTKQTKTAGPRVPGRDVVSEPKLDKGKEYEVAPAKDVRPVPRFSRRALLAAQVADRDNVQFRRNIVNRLWAMMMGRGLVHPVDLDHGDNPASHPELLAMLADEFAAMNFDVRAFLREVALSETYQRSSVVPAGGQETKAETFAVAALKPLSPEQLAWSLMQATGFSDAERLAQGAKPNEQALATKLAAAAAPVAAAFIGQAGQPEEFQATLDQVLFLANGNLLRTWMTLRAGNLADRLGKLEQPEAVAEELYLSTLTRLPSAEERREVAEYLQKRAQDRPAAVQELIWALLTSAEFRFNH